MFELEDNKTTIAVFGRPGLGKSHLAFQAKNALILDLERRANWPHFRKMAEENNSSIYQFKNNESMLREINNLKNFFSNLPNLKTIVIDSVSHWYNWKYAYLKASRGDKKDHGGIWVEAREDILRFISEQKEKYNLILIGHEKTLRSDEEGEEFAFAAPKEVSHFVDILVRMRPTPGKPTGVVKVIKSVSPELEKGKNYEGNFIIEILNRS